MSVSDIDGVLNEFIDLKNSLEKRIHYADNDIGLGIRGSNTFIFEYMSGFFKSYETARSDFERIKKNSTFTQDILDFSNSKPTFTTATNMLTQVKKAIGILESEKKLKESEQKSIEIKKIKEKSDNQTAINTCVFLCDRFHIFSRQLRKRRKDSVSRPVLNIKDEYDVQYLLNALLNVFFNDVKCEEPTESLAGSSARMDFYLKKEKIAIETKMTRETYKDKGIKYDIIKDIADFKQHSNYNTLIYMIYDPGEFIANPSLLERDLSESNNKFQVIVKVIPKKT